MTWHTPCVSQLAGFLVLGTISFLMCCSHHLDNSHMSALRYGKVLGLLVIFNEERRGHENSITICRSVFDRCVLCSLSTTNIYCLARPVAKIISVSTTKGQRDRWGSHKMFVYETQS